jgi:hypothetical protein
MLGGGECRRKGGNNSRNSEVSLAQRRIGESLIDTKAITRSWSNCFLPTVTITVPKLSSNPSGLVLGAIPFWAMHLAIASGVMPQSRYRIATSWARKPATATAIRKTFGRFRTAGPWRLANVRRGIPSSAFSRWATCMEDSYNRCHLNGEWQTAA